MSRNVRLLLLLVATTVVALALVAASSPAPNREVVYIRPQFMQPEYWIGPGQQAIVRLGWMACSRGLTDDYREASDIIMTLSDDGVVVQTVKGKDVAKHWTRAEQRDPSGCLWNNSHNWVVYWMYDDLMFGESGDYYLEFQQVLTEPVIDGGGDENGQLAVYQDPLEASTTIHFSQ